MPTYDAFQGRPRNPFWADPRYATEQEMLQAPRAPAPDAPGSLMGALADPQFRAEAGAALRQGAIDMGLGALQGNTTDSLGMPVDVVNMLLQPFGIGSQEPVGGSAWLARKAIEAGLMDPPKDNLQYNAGRVLGPIAMMRVPDLAMALGGRVADAAVDFANHSNRLNPLAGQSGAITYHGSPHKFDKFDMSKIGTGEGAQAYGHGLYLADSPDVAKQYQRALADKVQRGRSLASSAGQELPIANAMDADVVAALDMAAGNKALPKNQASLFKKAIAEQDRITRIATDPAAAQRASAIKGRLAELQASGARLFDEQSNLYTVDLPDEAIAKMLDWDLPLNEQAPEVRDMVTKAFPGTYVNGRFIDPANSQRTGRALLDDLAQIADKRGERGMRAAEPALKAAGVPGIRYLDGGSRAGGKGTSNYVVFSDDILKILKRE